MFTDYELNTLLAWFSVVDLTDMADGEDYKLHDKIYMKVRGLNFD